MEVGELLSSSGDTPQLLVIVHSKIADVARQISLLLSSVIHLMEVPGTHYKMYR